MENNNELDAERYHWLRDVVAIKRSQLETFIVLGEFDFIKDKNNFDKTIDMAMKLRNVLDISSKEFDLRMKDESVEH